MSRIGILSMQRIANYGSFLQAYGLKSILEELGCEVEFVDYHPGSTLIAADSGTGLLRKISKVIEVFKYNAPLKEKIKYIKYKKNYAKKYYPYLAITEKYNYSPELDVLVIGSDEVFNCVQGNTNVGFSPELFGVNSNAKRVISYAASFGNTTLEKLCQYEVERKVGSWLDDLDSISVRDNNSGRIVERISNHNPQYHLDPVLIYDFFTKNKDIPKDIQEDKYMILYGYSGRFSKKECKEIKKYAVDKGLKIFCIGGVQNVCDKFIDCNPFRVLAYFKNADCVVTDTFHGTIMSVIAKRQFVTLVRDSGYGNSEKLIDLLERLNLRDREITDLLLLSNMLEKEIDYVNVHEFVENERKRSYEYLRKEIDICIQS